MMMKLFLTFMKIGLIGFGGGMAILPLIYQGMQTFGEVDSETFANLFAISQATPGPIAINAATFVGFQAAGIGGAAVATIGVTIPSFLLVWISARILEKHRESALVQGAFQGVRPATVGMIGAAFIVVGQAVFFQMEPTQISSFIMLMQGIDWIATLMVVATVILMAKTKMGTIKIMLLMGTFGSLIFH